MSIYKFLFSQILKDMLPNFPFLQLHSWYLKNGRHNLPWRDYSYDTKTLGYRVWLAEIMLQQTQVERVKEYFENILTAFPTIDHLANTDYEDFFPYYKGLGYYSRARNMLKTAKIVSQEFNGIFPKETHKLIQLPGIGPYTAEAIRAFSYNLATLSFDTNLEKIFSRYYYGNKFKKLTKDEKQEILKEFQALGISGRDINNALMDYGATISLNSVTNIDWENYPLTGSKFYKTQGSLEPTFKKQTSSFPNKQAYVIAILHEKHKTYFSESTKFTPSLIGKNTGNPRIMIQKYFSSKYGLELSVRPPEIKSYNQTEKPYIVCYAQIQSGKHNFQRFEGLKVRGFEETYIENIILN